MLLIRSTSNGIKIFEDHTNEGINISCGDPCIASYITLNDNNNTRHLSISLLPINPQIWPVVVHSINIHIPVLRYKKNKVIVQSVSWIS